MPRIDYWAPQHVRDAIASLGRTEDLRFSPSHRRLAVAGFSQNKITVFEVSIAGSENSKNIVLTAMADITSPYLKSPHGLDFIDDEKILVANRDGEACIFELPANPSGSFELVPSAIIRSEDIFTPGSVAVIRNDQSINEALICNNYSDCVTRHVLDSAVASATNKGEVLLWRAIAIPDGIGVSEAGEWIAVSNHGRGVVFVYRNNPSLNQLSLPVSILLGTNCPHGLRFASDDRFILVADAGSPLCECLREGRSKLVGRS